MVNLRLSARLIATLVIMWSSYATAGVITVHFPTDLADNAPFVFHNSTADGFRISPRCHYDNVINPTGVDAIPGIGWDSAGCGSFPSGFNPAYLGPSTNPIGLYVDHNGSPFGLLSIGTLGEFYSALSSKGGLVAIPSNLTTTPIHIDFSGLEWREVSWVLFTGDSGVPNRGLTQLIALVPEPSTFILFGLGALVALAIRCAGSVAKGRRF